MLPIEESVSSVRFIADTTPDCVSSNVGAICDHLIEKFEGGILWVSKKKRRIEWGDNGQTELHDYLIELTNAGEIPESVDGVSQIRFVFEPVQNSDSLRWMIDAALTSVPHLAVTADSTLGEDWDALVERHRIGPWDASIVLMPDPNGTSRFVGNSHGVYTLMKIIGHKKLRRALFSDANDGSDSSIFLFLNAIRSCVSQETNEGEAVDIMSNDAVDYMRRWDDLFIKEWGKVRFSNYVKSNGLSLDEWLSIKSRL